MVIKNNKMSYWRKLKKTIKIMVLEKDKFWNGEMAAQL